jgi:cobyrinic acid a,c-diamide synthase
MNIPRLVIAGTGSGVGKTTTVLSLAMALQKRGLRVAVFKCGPDYLDPTYHEKVTGRVCHNLDSWMMGRESVLSTFIEGSRDADLALIEGVMGLYDGVSPDSNTGSTAEIAQWLGAPVLLTLDASGMARTFAAIVNGLKDFEPTICIAGAIANFVGSEGHLSLLRTAVKDIPVVGGFPKAPEHAFPERHLGLHVANESSLSDAKIEAWGALCEKWFDLDKILEIAKSANTDLQDCKVRSTPSAQPRCRIAIARDEAFHFYYEENLRLLQAAGAELVYFSPIRDQELPVADGVYIGGGYPELHAEKLSSNISMRESIRKFSSLNRPIYAECGGLMYLTDEIKTLEGRSFPMVGLISGITRMRDRLQALGYVEVTTEGDTALGPAGTRFRGHQFRYSELELAPLSGTAFNYRLRRRKGKEVVPEGYSKSSLLASYVHGHWASNPSIASSFVAACLRPNESL